jgi:exodeoxyribonuclease VII small subunit
MSEEKQTIAENLEQLEELLAWFESEEITVEAALEKYEQALKLSKTLEKQLTDAKNKVEVIKKKFS